MNQTLTVEQIGSLIRRVREDKGMSRAALASEAGIGARTLYALEKGESSNFGLGNLLKVLDVLGLSLSIGFADVGAEGQYHSHHYEMPQWDTLADIWRLDSEDRL